MVPEHPDSGGSPGCQCDRGRAATGGEASGRGLLSLVDGSRDSLVPFLLQPRVSSLSWDSLNQPVYLQKDCFLLKSIREVRLLTKTKTKAKTNHCAERVRGRNMVWDTDTRTGEFTRIQKAPLSLAGARQAFTLLC